MQVIRALATTGMLAAVAFVSAMTTATAAVAAVEPCNLLALAPIVSSTAATTCTQDSGLKFLPPTLPSADQVPKLCASSACKSLLAELKKLAPTECTLAITTPPMALYAQLVTPLEKACEAPLPPAASTATPTTAPSAAPSEAPSTTAPSTTAPVATTAPTTIPPAGPTVVPAVTTAAPPTKEQC